MNDYVDVIIYFLIQILLCLTCYKIGRKDWSSLYSLRKFALVHLILQKYNIDCGDLVDHAFDEKGIVCKVKSLQENNTNTPEI